MGGVSGGSAHYFMEEDGGSVMGSKNKSYGKMDESTARWMVTRAIYYNSKSFFKPGVGEVTIGDKVAVVRPCGSVDVFKFELDSFLSGAQ